MAEWCSAAHSGPRVRGARSSSDTGRVAYDEDLAWRIREALVGEPGIAEKRMFGGLAFLVRGKMAVAAGSEGALMVRTDPAESGGLLDPPHVRRFEMRGREMGGWLHVDSEALESEEDLRRWVVHGAAYARSLAKDGT